jgi:hypothetical protein
MELNPSDGSIRLSFSERVFLPPDTLRDSWPIDEAHILLGAVMQAREMVADLNPGDFPTHDKRMFAQSYRTHGIGVLDSLLHELVPLIPADVDTAINKLLER